MSTLIFLAVISSAFFQATWNFFTKKSKANKSALLLVGWLFFGIVAVPIASAFTDFSTFTNLSYKYILLSGAIHCAYVLLLGWAYTVGEISVVYPIARGFGVALTTIFSWGFGIDHLSHVGVIGIASVILGTLIIGINEILINKDSKGFYIALLVGIAISSYSLADSRAVYHVPSLFFISIMNLTTVAFALPIMLTRLKKPVLVVIQKHKREAFFVAGFGSLAYLVIIWAFTQAAASYIVALREFSIVIASVLGFIFLKEKIYRGKIIGLFCIVSGILLIKFS